MVLINNFMNIELKIKKTKPKNDRKGQNAILFSNNSPYLTFFFYGLPYLFKIL